MHLAVTTVLDCSSCDKSIGHIRMTERTLAARQNCFDAAASRLLRRSLPVNNAPIVFCSVTCNMGLDRDYQSVAHVKHCIGLSHPTVM